MTAGRTSLSGLRPGDPSGGEARTQSRARGPGAAGDTAGCAGVAPGGGAARGAARMPTSRPVPGRPPPRLPRAATRSGRGRRQQPECRGQAGPGQRWLVSVS